MPCTKKVTYKTREGAVRAVANLKHAKGFHYCAYHGGYHVTGQRHRKSKNWRYG